MLLSVYQQLLSLLLPISPPVLVENCLTANNVPFEISSSQDWTSWVTPFNLRLFSEPIAIAVPNTTDQVRHAVNCAAQAGLKVQAKCGGHSYASYSNGGHNGSLIVNLQEFNSIDVDSSQYSSFSLFSNGGWKS